MIGHELTAKFQIDHARTLAIVLPALLQECRQAKREKLLQYAERIWGLGASTGTEEQRIDAAIACTRDFFEGLGIATRLSAYGVGEEAIDGLVAQLQAHGMDKLGERRAVTPEVSRRILQAAL